MPEISPFFSYMGNKDTIAPWIISHFPPHEVFVECFGGTGSIHRNKTPSKFEVYNDFNPMLSNLFNVVRTRYEEFDQQLQELVISEHWYDKFYEYITKEYNSSPEMEMENAVRYFYIMSLCFKAKFNGGMNFDIRAYGGNIFEKKREIVSAIFNRFKNVQILNKSFEDIISGFNREGVLVYLDPPYIGTESYYKLLAGGFTEAHHYHLRDMLYDFKGYFILSYEDDELLREMYGQYFYIVEKDKKSHGRKTEDGKKKVLQEVIVTNYKPTNSLFSYEQLNNASSRQGEITRRLV